MVAKFKPKKPKKIAGYKTELAVSGGKSSVGTAKAESAGGSKSTYKKEVAYTGDGRYGKDNKDAKQPAHVLEAQKNKQDISFDKDNKPYRAGRTTTEKVPAKFSVPKPEIKTPDVKLKQTPIYEKSSDDDKKKKMGKLKPMQITLGGSNKKGGPANKKGTGFASGKIKIFKSVSKGK